MTDVAAGDRVFGIADGQAGAAELALLTYRAIIPPSLGFVDAAGLPAALETATRALDRSPSGSEARCSSTVPPAGSAAPPSSSPSHAARA